MLGYETSTEADPNAIAALELGYDASAESIFAYVVLHKGESEARAYYHKNPTMDLQKPAKNGILLPRACAMNVAWAIDFLLHLPGIEPNAIDGRGCTALSRAALEDRAHLVRLLLEDPRVRANQANYPTMNPLYEAVSWGSNEIVELLMASGKPLGPMPWEAFQDYNPPGLPALLEQYEADPLGTTLRMRRKHNFRAPAAQLFALIVYLCDDYFRLRPATRTTPAARFAFVASRLPMELQMRLCNLAAGFEDHTIPQADVERGFMVMARVMR